MRREETKLSTQGTQKSAAGLPSASQKEPGPTLDEQRQRLIVQAQEIESALLYMGALHPLRQSYQDKLKHLRDMLQKMP